MSKKSTSHVQTPTNQSPSGGASPWLHRPVVDLVVGCGAWSGPLLLAAYWLGTTSTVGLSIAFYALALAFNYPHYMATLHRAYSTRDDFTKYRIFTVHLTALTLLTMILAHLSPRTLPWIFTLYVTWSPWHYTGQNFGLAMMFARRSGATPGRAERHALYAAFVASYLLLFLGFHTGASDDRLVLSLGLPPLFSRGVQVVLFYVFVVAGGWALFRLSRQVGWRQILAPLVLLSTQFLWFVLPAMLTVIYGAQLPQTRYSTGVLAIMHAAQYMWITSYYARREAQQQGNGAASWSPWVYFGTLVIGGIVLFVPGPWLISYVLRYDYAASFLIFTAVINIHHFMLDGAIWKLRDGRIAALLIGARGGSSSVPAHATNETGAPLGRLTRWAQWLTGPSAGAARLRVSFVVVLLVVALLDQARFYLGIDGSRPENLARAAAINPNDAILQVRIANALGRNGETERKIASLERAVAINPYYFEPRNALAELLLQNKRYDQAYAQYQQMLAHVSPNANALVNHGLLAAQFGDESAAVDSWRRAIETDPTRITARLYLAEALYRRGQMKEAIPHYEQGLALLAAGQGPESLDPGTATSATLKLAGAYARTNNTERALALYEQIIEVAEKSGEKAHLSFALVNAADVYAAHGQTDRARQFYRRALALDASAGDARAEGADWFNYGQFLRRNNSPGRLVLACFLKAEDILKGKPEAVAGLETVAKVRREFETSLGAEASAVRRDFQSVAEEARRP
ncbi:MAG: tetratricopeptide repeat protein [Pyrinomonadaceae bacterium]|nr:tetratricopeptide repeat protein [Pyrinomonadaceae bacterium]